MLTYVIVVNDAGELKTISQNEIVEASEDPRAPDAGQVCSDIDVTLENVLNYILDRRAIAAGEYDPSDNDTPPMVFTAGDE